MWAEHEFGGARLGDVRLGKRLVQIVQRQGEAPTKSFPGAAQNDQAADSEVTPENILAPHRQRTLQRMQGQSAVLCIQDGTDLNFAEHPGCVGLGYIGKNKGSAGTLGLHMHATLVVNGEGVPLGVPQIQFETPDGKAEKDKPLERRKTYRWIRGLRECAELAGQLAGVRPVSVLDREAQVELRWREVELTDPDRQEAALKLRLVHVREQTQPEGAERLEWFLLTTLAVQTQQEAERVLEWYKLRWRIEDWYRVLKSGCKVEYLGHRQGERIERAVTINAVIAWRLTLMTLLGRDTPELPADTLFTEIELAALEDFAQDRRQLPPDNLGRAVLTLAMLGGYLNYKRKQYAVPGHKVMWEGYTRLATITQVVERTRRLNEDSKLYQKMRRE